MQTRDLNSWEEFEEQANEILKKKKHSFYPLFRGHEDSKWLLKSTLYRLTSDIRIDEYCEAIKLSNTEIKSFINKYHDIETEMDAFLKKIKKEVKIYEYGNLLVYMTYLRHNGYPSPLLDWTQSFYKAAFFAFRNLCSPVDQRVAIFCYISNGHYERSGYNIGLWSIGHNIDTDQKHLLQQSEYTYCFKINEKKEVFFASHEAFFKNSSNQDAHKIIKFTLPLTERLKVLKKLDLMNVNAYSLFNTEQSLMDTLAFRHLFTHLN